jgi:hypothetical protein
MPSRQVRGHHNRVVNEVKLSYNHQVRSHRVLTSGEFKYSHIVIFTSWGNSGSSPKLKSLQFIFIEWGRWGHPRFVTSGAVNPSHIHQVRSQRVFPSHHMCRHVRWGHVYLNSSGGVTQGHHIRWGHRRSSSLSKEDNFWIFLNYV